MALVVLLRGVNVGGHRSFRPTTLAAQLTHLGAVNIGAAGTLVIRRPAARADVRAELQRLLPFSADIVICNGRDIVRLLAENPFPRLPADSGIVRFVSVLTGRPRAHPALPLTLPSTGQWLLKVLARDRQFVFGMYRRHMKVIGYLGSLDRMFGVALTTRNWNTITAIGRALDRAAR